MNDRNSLAALRHVGTLLAIAENGSISAAAAALATTQSAMTKALQRAEEDFGQKLFERGARGVVPTAAGEAALRHAKLIRQHSLATVNEIDALRDFPGKVEVGAGASFLDALLPSAIARVVRRMPTVRIRLRVESVAQLLERLRAGEIDLVFVSELPGVTSMTDLEWSPVINNEMNIVGRRGHPLADREIVAAEELVDYGWVLGGETDPQQRYLDGAFRAKGLVPPVATVETLSRSVAMRIVQQSDLLTLIPNARTNPSHGALGIVNCPDVHWVRVAGVAQRRGFPLPLAGTELIAEIRAVCESF